METKIVVPLVIILFVAGFAVAWVAKPPEEVEVEVPVEPVREKPEKIRLGYIGAYTGPASLSGLHGHWAFDWIVDKVNAEEGGILGVPIEVVHEDEGASPAEAVDHANRLIIEEKVDAIFGPVATSYCLAIAPVANDAEVLHFNVMSRGYNIPWVDPADPTKGVMDWVFDTCQSVMPMALSVVWGIQTFYPEVNTTAMVLPDYSYGHQTRDVFVTGVEKFLPGVEVVLIQAPKLFEPDYTPYITELIDADPDLICVTLWGGDFVRFVGQIAPYGILQGTGGDTWLSGPWTYMIALGEDMPDFAWGHQGVVWGEDMGYPDPDTYPPQAEFITEFFEENDAYPFINSYDAVGAFAAYRTALEKAYDIVGGWPTKEEIREALEDMVFTNPVTGRHCVIRGEDHCAIWDYYAGVLTQHATLPWTLEQVYHYPGTMAEGPPGVDPIEWLESL